MHLLDSNTIIDYLAAKLPPSSMLKMHEIVNGGLFISVISQIEVLGYNTGYTDIDTRNALFIDLAEIFTLSTEIVQRTIAIRKQYKIKLPDAIIAATALVHDFTLITRNSSDFKRIDALRLTNPYEL
ncbi:type II toxin-antitoxin system VapC family toxin [Larkinella punicea]|uniref:Type II toxin-antitoxin system VapC family toxin n=1 Tax=Larkinella punicea TaxID=2315727 RepID=A0A368JF04_9BACT|nr:type II toxin-antitoxin system VapC family toxin [Larkinella punicea]RCR66258.1 type II toxin-antitoxin system VapC family toxin [Larkinella punicea]